MEANGGLPSWEALYLDLLPSDATYAKTEHLGDCLLGRPATSHVFWSRPDIGALSISQDARLKPRGVTLQNSGDPLHAHDINPQGGELMLV